MRFGAYGYHQMKEIDFESLFFPHSFLIFDVALGVVDNCSFLLEI